MVNDALLDFGLGIARGNRLRKTVQVVHADDENVLNTAITQVIQYAEPRLARLILADPHTQYILVPIQINPDDHVGGFVDNRPVLLDLEVNGIHINDGVYALNRPILPLFDEWHDLVGDIGNERGRDFNPIQVLQIILKFHEC